MSKKGQTSTKKFSRGVPTRESKPLILIVCEGEKTEPQYFNGLRKYKRLSTTEITVYGGESSGTHPKSVVEYARKKQKERSREDAYDEVWCVFDRDEHENIEQAFNLAAKYKIKVAFSNPNFELWFLLHYQDQRGALSRHEAIKKLKTYVPDYEKNSSDMYQKLLDKQQIAINRASFLREMHLKNGDDEKENPSSTVDLLILRLNNL
jgi:hypothetical protein